MHTNSSFLSKRGGVTVLAVQFCIIMRAGSATQWSDRINPRKVPVAAHCFAPGFHSIVFFCQGRNAAPLPVSYPKPLKLFLSVRPFSQPYSHAEGCVMATIDMIRLPDGRTIYPCGTLAYPPTNPKAGSATGGNTIIWNGRTRQTTLNVPRQNPVNIDTWTPQANIRYTGPKAPTTYQKPQPLRSDAETAAAVRRIPVNNPCPPFPNLKALCET